MIYIPFLYGSYDGNPINNTINYICLVVLIILKNDEFVNGKDCPIYYGK